MPFPSEIANIRVGTSSVHFMSGMLVCYQSLQNSFYDKFHKWTKVVDDILKKVHSNYENFW